MTHDEALTRAAVIRERVRADLVKTLREHLGLSFVPTGAFLDALTEDAMVHVETQLSLQVDAT